MPAVEDRPIEERRGELFQLQSEADEAWRLGHRQASWDIRNLMIGIKPEPLEQSPAPRMGIGRLFRALGTKLQFMLDESPTTHDLVIRQMPYNSSKEEKK